MYRNAVNETLCYCVLHRSRECECVQETWGDCAGQQVCSRTYEDMKECTEDVCFHFDPHPANSCLLNQLHTKVCGSRNGMNMSAIGPELGSTLQKKLSIK